MHLLIRFSGNRFFLYRIRTSSIGDLDPLERVRGLSPTGWRGL